MDFEPVGIRHDIKSRVILLVPFVSRIERVILFNQKNQINLRSHTQLFAQTTSNINYTIKQGT
ncbi:hypothetical protein DSLASN_19460 [Desulfoluna limicola]|uniref:Uncharacterized protein n=1 Tax=Desulfoluna limicola TaxID=2810562 RepID=A0ABM7PGI1_9BACT|nr:hypothetical protein DSLASN_19460 [Desulfoluna limicola]